MFFNFNMRIVFVLCVIVLAAACSSTENETEMKNNFGDDVDFLEKYSSPLVLESPGDDAKIIVVPEYQGRVMTSTINGDKGQGFGWINYDKIASGEQDERFNNFGGEDRFWLGPEGGQFSLFHKPGGPFDLDNWYVPRQVDARPYQVIEQDKQTVTFESEFEITNYSNTIFNVKARRKVGIFSPDKISKILNLDDPDHFNMVGFESVNHLINQGESAWNKEDGLISIWILGMYEPGDKVVIFLPYYEGGTGSLGEVVNDEYFGKVPPERLKVSSGMVFFKGDGEYRSKIGLNWMRAKDLLGSYDPEKKVLTIVKYNKPEEGADYVKSMWEVMEDPYGGDVVNSYNDGPPAPGVPPLGPFYELETSSPARELGPGDEIVHIHQTFHIGGKEEDLNRITEDLFNLKIQDIKDAF